MSSSRFSLFFMQKRAFKVFNKEAKQDRYSTKRLLEKSFFLLKPSLKMSVDLQVKRSPYYGHMSFFIDYVDFNSKSDYKKTFAYNCFCIHCGMNIDKSSFEDVV